MSLPDQAAEVTAWRRASAIGAALLADVSVAEQQRLPVPQEMPEQSGQQSGRQPAPPLAAAGRVGVSSAELRAVRATVRVGLLALGAQLEQVLPAALAAAPQAWDRVDHLVMVFDAPLTARIVEARRRLEVAAAAPNPAPVRAAGLEGMVTLDAACGLARMFEQRLSSLIRLRVRTGNHDLLPGGRPFLDIAAAFKEAAGAWV